MRLSKIVIRRFKSIDEIEITIPKKDPSRPGSADFVSIVGPNNAGKSSTLEAICLACPFVKTSTATEDQFPNRNIKNGPIEVELEFNELNGFDIQQQAIGSYVHNGIFRIRKSWDNDRDKAKYAAFAPSFIFHGLTDLPRITSKEGWLKNISDQWRERWRQLTEEYETTHGTFLKFNKESVEKLKRYAEQTGSPVAERKDAGWTEWTANPGGISANIDTVLPQVIFVPAIRETKEEVDASKAKSAVHQIVKAMFEEELNGNPTIVRFKETAKQVEALFRDAGKHRVVADVEERISSKIQELINLEAYLSFTAPDVSAGLAENTRFFLRDGDLTTKPENQGHGAQRAVILSLLQLLAEQLRQKQRTDGGFRRPILLLIEEPEIYLHPEMCRRMRDALLRLAQSEKAQVICATHSPVFLDLADRHDGILMLRREGRQIKWKQRTDDIFGHEHDADRRDHLRMVLNFNSFVNETFFTDQVCLVEGDTEIAALDAVAVKLSREKRVDWITYLSARRRLALINCRGKATIPAFQHVLNSFEIGYRVVHDKDPGTNMESMNAQIIEHLGGDEARRRIHDPCFEKQFFGHGSDKDKPWAATKSILDMSTISDDLLNFFLFTIGKTMEQLQAVGSTVDLRREHGASSDAHGESGLGGIPLLRKNHRSQLARSSLADLKLEPCSVGQAISIAAGPNRILDLEDNGHRAADPDGPPVVIAKIRGDSMADTLCNGDTVVLRPLQRVELKRADDDSSMVDVESFRGYIKNNGVYVLAIDNDIDDGAYTIKRVYVDMLGGGGWLCRIVADNRETDWGDHGQRVIRRTNRVHFAAELVSLIEDIPANALESAQGLASDTGFTLPERHVELDPTPQNTDVAVPEITSVFPNTSRSQRRKPPRRRGSRVQTGVLPLPFEASGSTKGNAPPDEGSE